MTEARETGNEALANLLADHAAKYLVKIADMQAAAEQPAAQQQQQVQPDKGEPEDQE